MLIMTNRSYTIQKQFLTQTTYKICDCDAKLLKSLSWKSFSTSIIIITIFAGSMSYVLFDPLYTFERNTCASTARMRICQLIALRVQIFVRNCKGWSNYWLSKRYSSRNSSLPSEQPYILSLVLKSANVKRNFPKDPHPKNLMILRARLTKNLS